MARQGGCEAVRLHHTRLNVDTGLLGAGPRAVCAFDHTVAFQRDQTDALLFTPATYTSLDFLLPQLAPIVCRSSVIFMSFNLFGCSANIAMCLPYGVGTFQGSASNTRRQIYRPGLLDSRVAESGLPHLLNDNRSPGFLFEQMIYFFFTKFFWFKNSDTILSYAGERDGILST